MTKRWKFCIAFCYSIEFCISLHSAGYCINFAFLCIHVFCSILLKCYHFQFTEYSTILRAFEIALNLNEMSIEKQNLSFKIKWFSSPNNHGISLPTTTPYGVVVRKTPNYLRFSQSCL